MRMLQLGRSLVVTTLVAGLGATLSSGCAENESSVYVVGVLAPKDKCTFDASIETPRSGTGQMCAAKSKYATSQFLGHILIANQLTKLADPSTLKTETNVFQIEGIEVNILNGDGSSAGNSYSAALSGTIPAANGGSPGLLSLAVPLIDGMTIGLGELVISEFRVFGHSLGGQELQTGWFRFPIIGWDCVCDSEAVGFRICDGSSLVCVYSSS